MKFSKSFLFAALIASSVTLTACNDKEQKTTQTTSQAEVAKPQEQVQIDELVAKADAEFKKAAAIKVTNVSATDDLKSFSVTYEIQNLSETSISSLQWITIYKEDNKAFYAANLPALQFTKTIAPKATESVTLSTSEEAVLSQLRDHLKPGKNLQIDIIGTTINFADGSAVGLTQMK